MKNLKIQKFIFSFLISLQIVPSIILAENKETDLSYNSVQHSTFSFELFGFLHWFNEDGEDLSAGDCLGFINVSCVQVHHEKGHDMTVIIEGDRMIFTSQNTGGLIPYPKQKNQMPSPNLIELTKDDRVWGGLTEVGLGSGLFLTSLHVIQDLGFQNFLKQRSGSTDLHYYLFKENQFGLRPDLVFVSKNEGLKINIQDWLLELQNQPTLLESQIEWQSWHFALNQQISESRFSKGVFQRASLDQNYFILDGDALSVKLNLATKASSGAVVWNMQHLKPVALIQCRDVKTKDIYALNLEKLKPIDLIELSAEEFESSLSSFKFILPQGFDPQIRKCEPLDGGEGKGGGGSEHGEISDTDSRS